VKFLNVVNVTDYRLVQAGGYLMLFASICPGSDPFLSEELVCGNLISGVAYDASKMSDVP
jgi:hypothetical protein